MNGWITFWTWCLAICVCLFALTAVAVIIGGARDIRQMFRRLKDEDPQATRQDEESSASP